MGEHDAGERKRRPRRPPSEQIHLCSYCDKRHGVRFLCDPAKKVLDAMRQQGMDFNQPTIEFPEPVTGPDALGPGTVLLAQLAAKAAVIPVADVPRPALVLTGFNIARKPLPQWVYVGNEAELRKAETLIHDMIDMAVAAARKRGGG